MKIDPKDARARFFTGLAKEQDGCKAAALADWKKLLAEADPAEPWLPDLRSAWPICSGSSEIPAQYLPRRNR